MSDCPPGYISAAIRFSRLFQVIWFAKDDFIILEFNCYLELSRWEETIENLSWSHYVNHRTTEQVISHPGKDKNGFETCKNENLKAWKIRFFPL